MFLNYDAYMMGGPPDGIEPLSLDRADRWNFTWELLTKDALPFENKLVALMEIRPPGSSSTMNAQARRAVMQKEMMWGYQWSPKRSTFALLAASIKSSSSVAKGKPVRIASDK